MAELKTKATNQRVEDFLNTIEPEQKRKDSFTLLEIFRKIHPMETGCFNSIEKIIYSFFRESVMEKIPSIGYVRH